MDLDFIVICRTRKFWKIVRAEPVEASSRNLRDAYGFVSNCTVLPVDRLRANESPYKKNSTLSWPDQ